ncbi:isopentenyl-diphosphate Delta-isomerase [Bailinhaonella thermotolerans]|uniref:Isopentenyl-diphosphate Delta-isomerase n=1 Tax=Bailinhaonella thermotolerans TaxID=1070861 RepID=A0A3A4AVH5_9ACTN|nr:isopentenyl-diphosphate Delta-isomerase [Bailinhaonella thermotolerans]RJL32275.1 isopentenyl-diphosphate Delta-isomerase [Bailinhaonella thermotolerans]
MADQRSDERSGRKPGAESGPESGARSGAASAPEPSVDSGGVAELVILVDEAGNAIGVAPKSEVHGRHTPLHLAFSSYVFDRGGRLLLTRRADEKITWPGVWTNSCCGHPLPGEDPAEAVARRLDSELGLRAERIDLVLPRFRYRAEMPNGVVEHELCPVYRVIVSGDPTPNPAEVGAYRWVSWPEFAASPGPEISPWCREQLPELAALGPDPLTWPTADPSALPPAARLR